MIIRRTIFIPRLMSHYIDLQISSGLYEDISEYIRDLIRKDQEQKIALQEQKQLVISELRNVLERAEASGISHMSMSEIRSKARARVGL